MSKKTGEYKYFHPAINPIPSLVPLLNLPGPVYKTLQWAFYRLANANERRHLFLTALTEEPLVKAYFAKHHYYPWTFNIYHMTKANTTIQIQAGWSPTWQSAEGILQNPGYFYDVIVTWGPIVNETNGRWSAEYRVTWRGLDDFSLDLPTRPKQYITERTFFNMVRNLFQVDSS
jgi:hypothetical protein